MSSHLSLKIILCCLIFSSVFFLPHFPLPAANIAPASSIMFDGDSETFIAKISPDRTVNLAWAVPDSALTFTIHKQGELINTDFIRGEFGFFQDPETLSGDDFGKVIQYTIDFQDAGSNSISSQTVSTGVFDLDSILSKAEGGICPSASGPGFSFSGGSGNCHLDLAAGVFELEHQINFFRQRNGTDGFKTSETGLNGLFISGQGISQTFIRPRQSLGQECEQQVQGDLTAVQDALPVTCHAFADDRLAQFSFASGGFQNLVLEAPDLDFGIVVFNPFHQNLWPDSQVEISDVALIGNQGVGFADLTGARMDLFTVNNSDGTSDPSFEFLQELQSDRLQISDSIITGFEKGLELTGGSPQLSGNILQNETDLFLQSDLLPNQDDWEDDFFSQNWTSADGQVDFVFHNDSSDFFLFDLRLLDLIPLQTSLHFLPSLTAFAADLSDPLIRSLLQTISDSQLSDTSVSGSSTKAFFSDCQTPSYSVFMSTLTKSGLIPSSTLDVVANEVFIEMRKNFSKCIEKTISSSDLASKVRPSVLNILNEYWKLLEGYPVQNPLPEEERFISDICTLFLDAADLEGYSFPNAGVTSINWLTQFSASCQIRLAKELDFAKNLAANSLDIDTQDEMYRTINFRLDSLLNWMSQAQDIQQNIISNLTKLMKQWDPLPIIP